MGFIKDFSELADILSTRNGRVMFTINLATYGFLGFLAVALYVFAWALTPKLYGG